MEQTDKQLLAGCRRGDQSAWEALVRRYQRLIYAIPRRAGLNEEDAIDVFQEVFTTLFRKLSDINDPDRLHAWLVTTARRKTARALAKSRQWHYAQDSKGDNEREAELLLLADEGPLAEEQMLRLEEQHEIRRAVDRLDERCRRLLELLFYRDEPPPYTEIAAILGIPEGSIGPTRARCLQKLMRMLGN